jgi:uroporphyrinogen-III decarboxylase
MVKAYKDAGATKVFIHCDGYDEDAFDLWVAAGIDATHPLEARMGMDPVAIREKYDGKLAIIGGLDNCEILPRGDRDEIERHVRHVLEAGRGGGLVLAPHAFGPDISVETVDFVMELWERYGRYPLSDAAAGS